MKITSNRDITDIGNINKISFLFHESPSHNGGPDLAQSKTETPEGSHTHENGDVHQDHVENKTEKPESGHWHGTEYHADHAQQEAAQKDDETLAAQVSLNALEPM